MTKTIYISDETGSIKQILTIIQLNQPYLKKNEIIHNSLIKYLKEEIKINDPETQKYQKIQEVLIEDRKLSLNARVLHVIRNNYRRFIRLLQNEAVTDQGIIQFQKNCQKIAQIYPDPGWDKITKMPIKDRKKYQQKITQIKQTRNQDINPIQYKNITFQDVENEYNLTKGGYIR